MAFQRDYVLRIIEMMGDFFRKIGERMDRREQLQALDEMCRDQCGLSLKAAFALKEETVQDLLPEQTRFMLSEITYLQSMLLSDEDARQAHFLRALRLLSALWEEENICEARYGRLLELMESCDAELQAQDYLNCARFLMAAEKLDDGEDAIFHAVEMAQEDEKREYIISGKALLIGLLSFSDRALILGGLPRDEVFQAINDLEKWEKA